MALVNIRDRRTQECVGNETYVRNYLITAICMKDTINTVNTQYFPNAKAYELRTWYTLQSTEMVYDYEDLYHRQRHDLEGQR